MSKSLFLSLNRSPFQVRALLSAVGVKMDALGISELPYFYLTAVAKGAEGRWTTHHMDSALHESRAPASLLRELR